MCAVRQGLHPKFYYGPFLLLMQAKMEELQLIRDEQTLAQAKVGILASWLAHTHVSSTSYIIQTSSTYTCIDVTCVGLHSQ